MRRTDRSRAYTLSYLSSVGFLPSYAFPTDTTSLFLERESVELSQDSVQALKDYAPGQLVYARGTKWLVEEVDLRRANLVNADGAGALPTVNICPRCDTVNDKTAASCLSCDNDDLLPQLDRPDARHARRTAPADLLRRGTAIPPPVRGHPPPRRSQDSRDLAFRATRPGLAVGARRGPDHPQPRAHHRVRVGSRAVHDLHQLRHVVRAACRYRPDAGAEEASRLARQAAAPTTTCSSAC